VQPYLFLNILNCLKKAIGLVSVYTLTGASCKKDFNKGVLLVAYMWSHNKKGNRVKHQDLEAISRLLVREESRTASNPGSEFNVGRGSSPGHVLHPFLLALHTNLAADVAKLGVCRTRTQGGGTLEWLQAVDIFYDMQFIMPRQKSMHISQNPTKISQKSPFLSVIFSTTIL